MNQLFRSLLAMTLLLWTASAVASGAYTGPNRDANGNIVPTPKGEQCVEPTADMRANHMKYLLHKRDLTMHEGIRTKQHSLVECIECHATPNEDGQIVRVFDDSGEHFCASCHIAASVKLDCFECHADRPVSSFSRSQQDAATDWQQQLEQLQSVSVKPHVAVDRKVQ